MTQSTSPFIISIRRNDSEILWKPTSSCIEHRNINLDWCRWRAGITEASWTRSLKLLSLKCRVIKWQHIATATTRRYIENTSLQWQQNTTVTTHRYSDDTLLQWQHIATATTYWEIVCIVLLKCHRKIVIIMSLKVSSEVSAETCHHCVINRVSSIKCHHLSVINRVSSLCH